jgi:hypothetical protein
MKPKSCDLVPKPVHFTLRAPLQQSHFLIDLLRSKSLNCGFKSVGELVFLQDEECLATENDPLANLKARSRGLIVSDGYAVSFMPKSFFGFELKLKNDNIMYVGLSEHESTVELPNGTIVETGLEDECHWQTFVNTFNPRQANAPLDCVCSHKSVCSLLKEAEDLDLLKSITDPTGYWNTHDKNRLMKRCLSIRSA